MLYSAKNNGFYDPVFNADNIPEDSVEITDDLYNSLLKGQSENKQIIPDENGYPVLQDPTPAPPYVPQQVTRAQGKAALIQAELWQDVLDYVDGITDPTERQLAEVALHDTTHWQRTSPFLNAAADALNITEQQMDALFQQAAEIEL